MAKRNRNPIIPPGIPEQSKQKTASIEAQAQVAKQARAKACMDEITRSLQRHNCRIGFVQIWTNGQPGSNIQVQVTALDAVTE